MVGYHLNSRCDASFRDPSGFVFRREGVLHRQVNRSYQADYDLLMGSGLYRDLTDDGWLIPHEEVAIPAPEPSSAYKVIRPERVPFVSHPYEWCFGQLKDAALLTLAIQKRAVARGTSLKDGSAYNVQFKGGRPVFIDTLSFEAYREGEPWVAYRQFCQHFLAPLALMALKDVRLNQLSRTNIDGIPLDLASRLLPLRSRLRPSLTIHLHLHAKLQSRDAGATVSASARPTSGRFGRASLLGLIGHLESSVRGLRWEPSGSIWSDYYQDHSYSRDALERKEQVVGAYLDRVEAATVWDFGANTGRFSRLAAARGAATVAFDADPECVERNYREAKRLGEALVLPLVLDLTNPSPASGWRNRERASLIERGPADAVLALALVHHLAIAHNLPLSRIAEFLCEAGRWAIVEFVPKGDPQVSRLLRGRSDVFPDYRQDEFERCFQKYFQIESSAPLPDGGRVIYLLRGRGGAGSAVGSSTPS